MKVAVFRISHMSFSISAITIYSKALRRGYLLINVYRAFFMGSVDVYGMHAPSFAKTN
jgi:hypothetical protein